MSDNLCKDLIFDIFTRLPAKSLLRFRSVSKSLCRCIGSPGFIRMHASRSPQKVLIKHNIYHKRGRENIYTLHSADRLPLCPGYIGIKAVEFPYDSDCECVGSCNGILCMFVGEKSGITLWKPSIRRKVTVPDCPGEFSSCCHGLRRCEYCRTTRGYAPDSMVLVLGFGFDPITDDYKIVSICQYQGTRKSSYIYTMKTGAWCVIASPAPSFYEAKSRGCFVNGALHWVVQSTQAHDEVAHFYILTFNLSTHVFGKIVLPEPNWKTKELTIIQGSLAAISHKHDDESWIWVMKEYNNAASWSTSFKLELNQVKVIGRLERVLQTTKNGDLLFETNRECFQVYDPKIRTRSGLQDFIANSYIEDIETYVESLQLLEKGTTCHGQWRRQCRIRGGLMTPLKNDFQ